MEIPAQAPGSGNLGLAEDRARRPLVWLVVLTSVATLTGTFVYSYPSTLLAVQRAMVLIHDVSGDLMIGVGVLYLWLHLARTFRMKRRVLSQWSGFAAVAIWTICGGTGVWGQIDVLENASWAWRAHIITAVALIVLGGFHAALGLRRRLMAERR